MTISDIDYFAVQHFTGYPERAELFMRELGRIGVTAHVHEQFPTPIDDFILARVQHQRTINKGTLSCTLGHYRIMKTAYENGADSIMVVEDDVRFPKDVSLFRKSLDAIPSECDYAKFEWFFGKAQTPDERLSIISRPRTVTWIDGRGVKAVGNGCYYMNRRAMKWKIDLIEDAFIRPGRGKLRVNDMYDRPWPSDSIGIYLSVPVMAIQGVSPRTVNETKKNYEGFILKGGYEAYGA